MTWLRSSWTRATARTPSFGERSTYERIKIRVDAAIAAIEDEGLNRETTAKGTLALLESVLLATYADHMGMIEAAVRMTNAAECRANG